ncbi:MAG: pentapeptide repeat-containing protein [Candidatus Tectomicrobia bacterium]|nr:pentapeptide repeat-containing protein [Candidatus Tectomicrobia bacterium]
MANPEHVQLLLESAPAWNKRRAEEEFGPNLEDVDVREVFRQKGVVRHESERLPLAGIDLSAGRLRGAKFHNADFNGAKFVGSDLRDADLSFCSLQDSNFIGADLEGTRIHNSILWNMNWANAEPWKAVLYKPLDELEKNTQVLVAASNISRSVSSLGGALRECKRLRQHYKNRPTSEPVLYFRGECNSGWELRPPVCREGFQGQRDAGGQLLVDLMSRQPEAFDEHNSALAQWVLAQHHGLKTGLLDINRNLAVALFFACGGFEKEHQKKENDGKDGALHIFAVPRSMVKPYNSDTISVISNFKKLSLTEQETLLGAKVAVWTGLDFHRSLQRLHNFIRQEKPGSEERINPIDLLGVYIVEPQRRFGRIRAQSGAFVISAFHERLEQPEVLKWNSGIPIYDHYKVTIPSKMKDKILDELKMLDISYETLFPGLDQTARAVTRLYSS